MTHLFRFCCFMLLRIHLKMVETETHRQSKSDLSKQLFNADSELM